MTKAEEKELRLKSRPPIYPRENERNKGSFDTEFKYKRKPILRYKAITYDWKKEEETKSVKDKSYDLLYYSFFGHKQRVEYSLCPNDKKEIADINVVDNHGNNALLLAIYSKDKSTIKFLANYCKNDFEKSINSNHLNKRSISALHLAVRFGDVETVKILLNARVNVNIKGEYGETPIFDAVRNNHAEMIDILLNYNKNNRANINFKNDFGETPLIAASIRDSYNDALEELINNKVDIRISDNYKKTCLMHSANGNCQKNINSILNKLKTLDYETITEFVNSQDLGLATALMYLAKNGCQSRIKEIISLGGDPKIKDLFQKEAFDYVQSNKNNCAKLLEIATKNYTNVLDKEYFYERIKILEKCMQIPTEKMSKTSLINSSLTYEQSY